MGRNQGGWATRCADWRRPDRRNRLSRRGPAHRRYLRCLFPTVRWRRVVRRQGRWRSDPEGGVGPRHVGSDCTRRRSAVHSTALNSRMTTEDASVPSSDTAGGQDVALVFLTRVWILAGGVAMQSLLAYTLLPTGRGSFAVCILFTSLFAVLFAPGVDAGAQYFVMTKKIRLSQGISVSLSICVLGSGFAAALAIPLIHSEIEFFQKAEKDSFYLALLLIPLTTFSSAVQHQLAGLRRFRRLASFAVIEVTSEVIAMVGLVLGLGLGVNGALAASAVGHLVKITACLRELHRKHGLSWEMPTRIAFTNVLRYGLKYYVARFGWTMNVGGVGGLLLGIIADRTDVAFFAAGSGLMRRLLMIPNSISIPLLPRVSGDPIGRIELVSFCVRTTAWIIGLVLAVLLVISTPLVRIFLSERFLPIVPLIWIMAPGMLVYGGASVLLAYFRGTNRPEVCSWHISIMIGTNVLTAVLLYPQYGVAAAAWGMTVGLVCSSALLYVIYLRATHEHALRIFAPQRGDGKRLLILIRSGLRRLHGNRES